MPWTLLDTTTAQISDGSTGHQITYTSGAPNNGELLVAFVASDTTVSTPAGWTLATSDVQNQGDYAFYRIAGTSEPSSVTVTTNGDFPTVCAILRYSGNTSTTPLDVTAVARVINADALTTPAISPDPLATTGELAIIAACNQEPSADAATAPTGSSGYANVADTGLLGSGASGVQLFAAHNTAATGSETPAITWATSNYRNRTALFVAFLPAASVDATVTVPAAMGGTAAFLTPAVAAHVTVTVPTAMGVSASLLAPTVPAAESVTGGHVTASASRGATLSGSASGQRGPHHG